MPSLESIRLPVDTSDMLKAVKASNTLERGIKLLKEAVDAGKITNDQYALGLKEIRRQNDGLFPSWQKARAEVARYAASLDGTTRASKLLAKEQQYIETTNTATARSFGELVTQVNTYQTANKSAATSADAFVEGLRKQEAQAQKTASTMQQYYNSNLGVSGNTASQSGAGYGALEGEINRLSMKYNDVYRASKLYESSLNEIQTAQRLGAISAGQYEAELKKLDLEYQAFANGAASSTNRFQQQLIISNKGMNQMGLATQQLGYQMGDFLVQVQSGTNWMVAFGQQATQAVAVLPMFATQLGLSSTALLGWATGLGVIIPLVTAIGAAWMRTREESNKTSKATKELEDRIKSLDRTLQDWLLTKEASKAGLTVDELIGAESLEDAKKKVADLTIEVKKLESAAALIGQGMAGGIDLQSLFGESPSDKLKRAIEELSAAEERLSNLRKKSYEETLDKSNEILKSKQQELELVRLEAKYGSDSIAYKEAAYKLERDAYLQKLAKDGLYAGEIQKIKDVMDSTHQVQTATEGANKMLQIGADLWATISSRAKAAADQAAAYASATAAGANLRTLPDERGSQRESTRSAAEANTSRILEEMGRNPDGTPKKPKKASGGGSAGREATQESRLQGFLSQTYDFLGADNLSGQGLENQLAEEQAAYDKRIAQLEAFRAKKKEYLEKFNELEAQLTTRHEQDIELIRQQAQNQQLNDMGGFFGAMASAMQAGGGKMVKVASVFSAAQALINSWTAYTEMLKDPAFVGRPWARFAAAASVLAAGLNAVKAIKSVGSGGGGGGGGGSASSQTSTAAATQTSTPQQVYISGLTADQLFTGEQLQNLFDNLQTENKNRGYVFVTARQ